MCCCRITAIGQRPGFGPVTGSDRPRRRPEDAPAGRIWDPATAEDVRGMDLKLAGVVNDVDIVEVFAEIKIDSVGAGHQRELVQGARNHPSAYGTLERLRRIVEGVHSEDRDV